jgi:hypothetical protein
MMMMGKEGKGVCVDDGVWDFEKKNGVGYLLFVLCYDWLWFWQHA